MKKRFVRIAFEEETCNYAIQFKFMDGDKIWKTDCSFQPTQSDGKAFTDCKSTSLCNVNDQLIWKLNSYISVFGCNVVEIARYHNAKDMWNCENEI